ASRALTFAAVFSFRRAWSTSDAYAASFSTRTRVSKAIVLAVLIGIVFRPGPQQGASGNDLKTKSRFLVAVAPRNDNLLFFSSTASCCCSVRQSPGRAE